MNLFQSELIEHRKVLKAFCKLPRDIKQYILTFYKTCSHSRVIYSPPFAQPG